MRINCLFIASVISFLVSLGHAQILVYKSSVNRWSSYFINDGTKSAWVTPPSGSIVDAYFLYPLDGTNRVLPAPQMTYRGQTFEPYLIYVDHKLKTKQFKGGTLANEADNTSQTFYGRARGPGGQRIFRFLYQQWEPNSDGSHDVGVSVADGNCQNLNVGGGKTGFYAMRIESRIWRLDGTFRGSISSYRDGLQLKHAVSSSDLALSLTQAINNRRLNTSQAFIYVIEKLFSSYTILSPDTR